MAPLKKLKLFVNYRKSEKIHEDEKTKDKTKPSPKTVKNGSGGGDGATSAQRPIKRSETKLLKPIPQRSSATSVRRRVSIQVSQKHKHEAEGGFTHLPEKDIKYFYEEETKRPDPFYHVDVATDCETYFIGQKARVQFRSTEHFAYIVDLDNYEYHKVVFHSFLNEILQSAFFRHGILFLVMVNAVLIGLATLPYLLQYGLIFDLLDMIILSVFIFEIIIKWIYDFRLFWTVNWNRLDFAIVALTLMASLVPKKEQGDSAEIFVRVVRAFRSLRCTSHMSSLAIVTHTVAKSGLDMTNILIVLIIFMLVLSVMAVILFDIEDLVPQRFLNALDAWIVLFICVTQDGWAEVLNGYDRGSRYFAILALYLIFAVSVGAFVFANLIVAVIVANLELSVKVLREKRQLHDNPLEISESYEEGDVDIVPVYDLLAKDNFVCISQRPLRIPRLKNVSVRKLQVYINLIVALEQNMLEAEIISLDLEKIMAVTLSITCQLDANIAQIAKENKDEVLRTLAQLNEKFQPPPLLSRHSTLKTIKSEAEEDSKEALLDMLNTKSSHVTFSNPHFNS